MRHPIYSTGVDTAVYMAAGEKELLAERKKIGFLEEGEVAITPGFRLPSKYIIHAVSPCYEDGTCGEEEKLRSCYRKSLELAYEYNCKSIAFPLIATGSFGYPKEEGMRVAVDEINAFLLKHEMLIYLVVFDTVSTQLDLNLYPALEAYIDHNYVCDKREAEYGDRYFGSAKRGERGYSEYVVARENLERKLRRAFRREQEEMRGASSDIMEEAVVLSEEASVFSEEATYNDFLEETASALQERMNHLADTFQRYLMYLIESRGLTNSEVYKRAIISKQLFSKIKLNPEHQVFDMIEIDIALEEHGLPCFIE